MQLLQGGLCEHSETKPEGRRMVEIMHGALAKSAFDTALAGNYADFTH